MNKYLQDEREVKGYVEIEYSDINNDIEAGDSWIYRESAPISEEYNINNKKLSQNYASLEQDYFLLDGSFVLPYMPEGETNYYNDNSGYITNDITGNFQNGLQLINTFINGKSARGITIYLKDNIAENIEVIIETNATYSYIRTQDEYAESGKVYYIYTIGVGYEEYDVEVGDYIGGMTLYERQIDQASETLTYNVTDNTKDVISFNFEEEKSISTLTMRFNGFEYENRRFRMSLIDFGLSDLLKDDRLISFDVIENIGELNLDFPTNQLTVNLYDEDDVFDINNPKGYADFLNQGLQVKLKPHIGILTDDDGVQYNEDLPIFYLQNWSNNKNEITLNCVDYLEKIKNSKNVVSVGELKLSEYMCDSLDVTLENKIGTPVKTFRNFIDDKYYISDFYVSTTNAFEYLKQLMIWLWGYIYIEDKNIIINKRENTILYDNKLSLNNNLLEEPKYTVRDKIKSVSITKYGGFYINNAVEDWQAAPTIYLTNSERAYNNQPEVVEFDTYHDLHVEGRNTSANIGIYKVLDASEWCPAVISPPTNITFYDLGTATFSTETFKETFNDTGKEIAIDNNFFENTSLENVYDLNEICHSICNKINEENKTYNISINYTGDPNIKPNMIVPIETQYGEKQVKVLKHTLKFNGGLTGTIEGVGD